jgi:dGTPase
MFEKVYRSESVMAPVRRSQHLVAELFDRYFATADMPGRWGEAARAAGTDAARARNDADIIAGMTDPYAQSENVRKFDAKGPVE